MKRIFAAGILTVSMLTLAFVGQWVAKDNIRKIQTVMEQVDIGLAAGDRETALKVSEDFIKDWDRLHGRLCLFLQHDHLDPLEKVFALLPFYITEGEITLARAECKNVCTMTEHILKTEMVTLENIF